MTVRKLSAIALFVAALNGQAFASGIPSVDIARITQAAEQAKINAQEALAQLNAAKQAISQAKSQYEKYESMIKGNSNLGDWLRDDNVNDLFGTDDLADLYDNVSDLGSLRSRYGLTSSNPDIQAQFDKLLAQAGMLEKSYDASKKRIENLGEMRRALDTAQTQQQKADLGLRLQEEQLELQNQAVQLQNTKLLMEQKDKIENAKYSNDMAAYYAGKTTTQPTKPTSE